MTPADTTSPPAVRTPRARARSIHGPDSRVSRPMRILEPSPLRSRSSTRAVPSRAMVGGSSGNVPATARTPSVPKSFFLALISS